MKKIVSIILILALSLSVLSVSVNAEFYYRAMRDSENGMAYMADENGTAITPAIYSDPHTLGLQMRDYYSEGYAAVEKDGKLGFIDLFGNEVTEFLYYSVGMSVSKFSEGLAWVAKDETFGAIDTKGNVVIPFEYEPIALLTHTGWLPITFKNGVAPVCKDGKYGFIDKNNNVVVPFEYDDIYPWNDGAIDHNGIAKMILGEDYVYVDMDGNEYDIYPGVHVEFDESKAGPVDKGGYKVFYSGKYGLVDEDGYEVLPSEYTQIMGPQGGGFKVYKDDSLYGFVDAEGNEITGLVYGEKSFDGNSGFSTSDYVVFKDDRARAKLNGKYGYIDSIGNEVIPFIYDYAGNFDDGYAVVKKDGEEFVIDTNGNRIPWPYEDGVFIGQRIEYTENEVSVMLNNNLIKFDQPAVIIDGRTMVPLRAIFEALGATVEWNGETKTVTSVKGENTISLTIGSNILYLNGAPITLDVPAQIKNERTLVPVRAISESFGVKVEWDGDTKTVLLQN